MTREETSACPEVEAFAPIQLGSTGGKAESAKSAADSQKTAAESVQSIIARLKPLQVVLGSWRGTTRNENKEGFKTVDEHEWVWDLTTNPNEPALVMASDKSPLSAKRASDVEGRQV